MPLTCYLVITISRSHGQYVLCNLTPKSALYPAKIFDISSQGVVTLEWYRGIKYPRRNIRTRTLSSISLRECASRLSVQRENPFNLDVSSPNICVCITVLT